jgi:ABC-2 type transport system ATP-binding protein
MDTLTRPTELLVVEVDGDNTAVAAQLRARGIRVEVDGRSLIVGPASGGGIHDIVRDTIIELDLGLVRLEQSRRRLEDLFHADHGSNGESDA